MAGGAGSIDSKARAEDPKLPGRALWRPDETNQAAPASSVLDA